MRKLALFIALVGFMTPIFASADALEPTPGQLLTRIAVLEAQQVSLQATSSPVSCAALFNVPSVAIGQIVYLAWGSVGALPQDASSTKSMWSPAGSSMMAFQKAGTWVYTFDFYGESGGSTTCKASIRVTP